MLHTWKEIGDGGVIKERSGECFWSYLHVDGCTFANKVIFNIPRANLDKIDVINKEFFLRFISGVLNKDVYSYKETKIKGASVTIDCAALNKNRFLVFNYLVFFRYLLEMPLAVNIFAEREMKKEGLLGEILSPLDLLISFLKQNCEDSYATSGCTAPAHCLVSQNSLIYGRKLRPVADIIRDLNDPAREFDSATQYFITTGN